MNRIAVLRCFLFCFLSILYQNASAQAKYSVSGTVKSDETGETIIGATIKVNDKYTSSNEYGFYSITLDKGDYTLEVSYVGFELFIKQIQLNGNLTLNVSLPKKDPELENVVITANSRPRNVANTQVGVEKLSTNAVKNIPVLMGERDILKVITLLPGVKSDNGTNGFNVRGGAADQNLILLDEAPVYNASHLLGFFSTFNSDAIKDLTLYKSGMPSQFGGRLSSVMDIKMNDGNTKDYVISGGLGLISSKINVEGPIQKDESSFLVSARRTYVDMFLKLSSDSAINRNSLYFYDVNAKMNFSLGKKDKIFISGYFGRDDLGVDKTFGLNWGNATATLRWNHIYNSKLFSNTSLIFSNYDYNIGITSGTTDFDIFSQIQDWNVKHEMQWFANNKNNVRFGVNAIHHTMTPGDVKAGESSSINSSSLQKRYSLENAAYISNTWKTNNWLNITYGLRLSNFTVLGGGDFFEVDGEGEVTKTTTYKKGQKVVSYTNLEPRLAASFKLDNQTSIKTSYVRNTQNLHLISNSTTGSPTDKWVASTNIIKPEISDQVSIGYYKNLFNNNYELTVEGYYKTMQNQIDYRDGANIYANTNAIESQLLYGKGRAYGAEFLMKKNTGKLTGWLSYTLSKTEKKIDGINNNQWYDAKFDRRHDIAIVGMYELNKKWSFSANWIYQTGSAVTFPAGKYQIDGKTVYYYTERNGYRMPANHRLDLGATMQLKKKKRWESELTFSIYNAYGRENAYVITFRDNKDDPSKTEAVRTALFKFIPSVSYNFKFK